MNMPIVKNEDYHRALVASLAEAHAEIERLHGHKEGDAEAINFLISEKREADAEIGRLRAALKRAADDLEANGDPIAAIAARRALEGK